MVSLTLAERHAVARAARGAAVLLMALCIWPAAAQPVVPTAEQQNELELIALARARTALLERISALPVAQGVTLGDRVLRDVELDRALRLWGRTRPREGNARHYSDAVCEVDVRAEPADLLEELLRLRAEYPAAFPDELDAAQLRRAARDWPILWATGRAALDRVTRAGPTRGWEDVSAAGAELARAAATADAYGALLAEAGRLKVTSARRLREFLDSSPAVRAAVQAELQRAARAKADFAADQVAVVEVRIDLRELLRILTRVHQEHYRGQDFAAADFRQMTLLAGRDELVATGLAAPPSATGGRGRYEPIEFNVPAWAATSLSAVGRYEPAADETADAAAQAAAARLDGIAQLDRQIAALVIQQPVTLAEYLGYHQDLKDDVALFLSGARVVAAPETTSTGGVEVRVELPLRRLWEIVRRDMKLEEMEPPASAPAAPAERTTP